MLEIQSNTYKMLEELNRIEISNATVHKPQVQRRCMMQTFYTEQWVPGMCRMRWWWWRYDEDIQQNVHPFLGLLAIGQRCCSAKPAQWWACSGHTTFNKNQAQVSFILQVHELGHQDPHGCDPLLDLNYYILRWNGIRADDAA
ncbi:uncharacterized protein LOC132394975 isoform X2 [Hypanus sabinus]|uniref:uncharacterized protein LOC132394975 isoform X2 n=1 Tax=Hypanus sabinus TaxID=79690 RepID=UPI0028C42CA3|nr:uncharacterized protein LOC132394975 isoform X2 [Hypanus sabinus]